MSLKFIYGRAGKGKTKTLINEIKEYKKKSLDEKIDKKLIMLVPDQLSFQSDKRIVKEFGGIGLGNIEVYTFKTLGRAVLQETGGIARSNINPIGRQMLLYRITKDLEDELELFKGIASKYESMQLISEVINELKKYDVAPELIQNMIDSVGTDTLLALKLNDIRKIYEKFEKELKENYTDTTDDIAYLAEKIKESSICKNALIWIDEFDMYDPQMLKVIEEMMVQAERVTVTLTKDEATKDSMIFNHTIKTEEKLRNIAIKRGVSIEEGKHRNLNKYDSKRFNEDVLKHLEKNFYRYPNEEYSGSIDGITISKYKDMYSEIEGIASKIKGLSKEDRYRDIGVICRDLNNYSHIIKSVFHEYEIPFFIDSNKSIANNPIVALVVSIIDIHTTNWNYDAIFKYLKNGMNNIVDKDVDLLENYILRTGIKGKKRWVDDEVWYANLVESYGIEDRIIYELGQKNVTKEYIIDQINNPTIEEMKDILEEAKCINNARENLIKHLTGFMNKVKGKKKAHFIAEEFFNLLVELNVPSTIEKHVGRFKEDGRFELAAEYSSIWNVLIEVLEQQVEILGETELSLKEFGEIFYVGLKEEEIGLIPSTLDQVLITSVERVRSQEVKHLFVIGVNDGVIPRTSYTEGILSDTERDLLKKKGYELMEGTIHQVQIEQYLVYQILTIASDSLNISFPMSDVEGKALRQSSIIRRLKNLYPDLQIESELEEEGKSILGTEIVAPIPTFNKMILKLRDIENLGDEAVVWKEAYEWYKNNSMWDRELENIMEGFEYANIADKLDKETTDKLYGEDRMLSVSRLERYAECPFRYFVEYGLKAKPRKKDDIKPPDIGTYIHDIVYKYTDEVQKREIAWQDISKEWTNKMVEKLADEYMDSRHGKIFTTTSRHRYFAGRVKGVIKRSVNTLVEQIKNGEFDILGYEMEFGKKELPPIEIELKDGSIVKLGGKIDRVDKLEFEGRDYYRVIDYKSGSKDFNLSDVYHGLQMQLFVYLDAIVGAKENKGEEAVPAGVLYFTLSNPMLKKESSNIEKALLEEMRMKGLVIDDVDIATKMDESLQHGGQKSLVIPVKLTKSAKFDVRSSSVASEEQFNLVRMHVRKKLKEYCYEILSGNINITPCKSKDKVACQYCEYSSVCFFNEDEDEFNVLQSMDNKEVWQQLEEGGKGNE